MNELFKNIISQIPILILVFFFIWVQQKGQISYSDIMEQMNQKDSIISQMIDNQGRLVTTHTNRQYSPYIINNSNDAEMVELRKELAGLGIKVNDLKYAININSTAFGNGSTDIIKDTLDDINNYVFNDSTSSEFLKIKGGINLKDNKITYDYLYSSIYSIYSYEYKKKFWKRPELQIKLVSNDPSNQIQMQTYTVKPPREIISIGLGIGASVYYKNGQVDIAPAITIGLFKPIYTFRAKN